jgi:hypothetical protein
MAVVSYCQLFCCFVGGGRGAPLLIPATITAILAGLFLSLLPILLRRCS